MREGCIGMLINSLGGEVMFPSLQHFIGSASEYIPCLKVRVRGILIRALNPRRELSIVALECQQSSNLTDIVSEREGNPLQI